MGSSMSQPAKRALAALLACAMLVALFFVMQRSYASTTLIEGYNNQQPSSMTKPVKGVPYTDPIYQTTVVRATDYVADGIVNVQNNPVFVRNDYSRRPAFNQDNSKYLVKALDGFWYSYDADTYAKLQKLPYLAGAAEPQWSPTDPDIIYYVPNQGGLVLNRLDISTGTTTVAANFAGRLPWTGAAHVSTRSEGSPSADGRYWGFQVDNASWQSLGVFTYDLQTDTILSTRSTNGVKPDHVSMSPSGDYFVTSGDDASGTVAYARNDLSTPVRTLHHKSEHSDLAIDANGDDVYVSIDYQSNSGDVFMVNLQTGEKTVLFSTYVGGQTTALHVSGKAYDHPGWALISTYGGENTAPQWFNKKIFAVELKANPRIYNLAHHHVFTYAGYDTEPHATVNRDFTKIMFNSNWETSSGTNIDAYMIRLEPGDIPEAGTGPEPTPTSSPSPTPTPTPSPTPSPEEGTITLQMGVNGYEGGKNQSHLRETSPNEGHYGAGQAPLYYLRDGGFPTNVLISFDLDDVLPEGAVLESATLSLHSEGAAAYSGGTLDMYRIVDPDDLGPWVEGTSDDYTEKDGAAWTRRAGTENTVTTGWTNVSGSTPMDAVATPPSGTIALGTGGGWHTSTDVLDDVLTWIEGTDVNQGWLLRTRDGSGINVQDVASNQHANSALRPKLTLTYSEDGEPTPSPCPTPTPTPTPSPDPDSVTLQSGVGGYTGGKDQSHIRETSPNEGHYGAGQATSYYLREGFATGVLLYFDLSGIVPTGATIDSAVLSLYNTGTDSYTAGTLELRRIVDPNGLGMWDEGANTDYTLKDGAAWTRRSGSGNTVTKGWTSTSGSTLLDAALAASGTVAMTTGSGWNASTDVKADVQAWIDGTAPNQGWYIRPASGSPINIQQVPSNQYGNASYRPKLTITYH